MKFESFLELVENIMNDKANAKDALDLPLYHEFSQETFMTRPGDNWIGSSGGDEKASYEFRTNEN